MTVTHARLMPPGVSLRSALELYGEAGEHAHVTIWYGMRGICSALKQAGFAVEHRHVWLPPRGEWPPLTTKVRFRQSGDAPEGPSIDPQGRSTVLATTTANETLPMWWAGLVFMTWGLFAWMPFTYAATRTGYKRWRGWAIAYGAAAIGALGLAALGHAAGGALRALDWLPLGLLAIGSFVHILAIRDEYSRRLASRRDPSLQLAQRQADLVQEARRLVAADPAERERWGSVVRTSKERSTRGSSTSTTRVPARSPSFRDSIQRSQPASSSCDRGAGDSARSPIWISFSTCRKATFKRFGTRSCLSRAIDGAFRGLRFRPCRRATRERRHRLRQTRQPGARVHRAIR